MRILINDANILIDLIDIDLLSQFAELPYELHTTDFVLAEVISDQKERIFEIINDGKFKLITTSEIEDYQGILNLLEKSSGLSFEDCSVWYYAKKLNGTLVTGDSKLRKLVLKNNIKVRGILFILDEILINRLLTFEEAIQKITLLYEINNRLPQKELEKRLELWKSKRHIE